MLWFAPVTRNRHNNISESEKSQQVFYGKWNCMDFKKTRENLGLTLQEVASKSGYSVGTISDLENKGVGSKRLKIKLREVYEQAFVLESEIPITENKEPTAFHGESAEHLFDRLMAEIAHLRVQLNTVETTATALKSRLSYSSARRAEVMFINERPPETSAGMLTKKAEASSSSGAGVSPEILELIKSKKPGGSPPQT
jgi:transcriptional regulator with XRE-family HTH domain